MEFKRIETPDCLLGENPVWYAPTSEFLWTDILRGVIYAYSPNDGSTRTVLETRYQTGAFLEAEGGSLVLLTEKGVMRAKASDGEFRLDQTPLWTVPFADGERFNDAIADPWGCIISGSKRADNTDGKLYRFAMGKEPEVLIEGLCISNGMGFSPDGRIFYHTDSVPSTITAYDYAGEGILKNPRILVRLDTDVDPDGMTVDSEGNIWTVCWGAGQILKLSPDGAELDRFPVGAPQCSSICFGGKNLNQLFVTSASVGSLEAEKPLGGSCFYAISNIRGKLDYLANIG